MATGKKYIKSTEMLVYNHSPRQEDRSVRGAGINKQTKKVHFLYPEIFAKIDQ